MFLSGTYELSIDAKNRLSIPFAIRRKLSDERDGQSFYVLPGRRKGTLALYAEKYYERLRADLPADDALSDDAYAYRQFESSQSALLDSDSQGRILIPERLLKRAGLDKDVVLIAVRDHLELWSRQDFEAFESGMWPAYPEQRAKAVQEMKALAPAAEAAALRPAAEPTGAQ
jgi:MraZ protein